MTGTKRSLNEQHTIGSEVLQSFKHAKHNTEKMADLYESIMEKNDLDEFIKHVETFVDENLFCMLLTGLQPEKEKLDKFVEFSKKHGDELIAKLIRQFSGIIRRNAYCMMFDGQTQDSSLHENMIVHWNDVEEGDNRILHSICILFHMAITHKKATKFDNHEATLLCRKIDIWTYYEDAFKMIEHYKWDWNDTHENIKKLANLKSVPEIVANAYSIYKLAGYHYYYEVAGDYVDFYICMKLWLHYFKQFKDVIANYSIQKSNEEMCTFLNIMEALRPNRYIRYQEYESIVVVKTFPYFLEIYKYLVSASVTLTPGVFAY